MTHRAKNIGIFIVLLLGLLSIVDGACGEVYFVAQNSAGRGDGSSYADRMSAAAHNSGSFKPGDTVYLCDTINYPVEIPSSGIKDQRITYRGDYPGHQCIIDRNNSMDDGTFGIRARDKDYITIQRMQITAAGNGIIIQTGADFIEVIQCEIYNCGIRGIFIASAWENQCTHIVIGGTAANGNTIRDCGTNAASADVIAGPGSHITVSYNQLYATREDRGIGGVWMVGTDGFLIERNSIHGHNKAVAGDLGKGGIACKYAANGVIRYNNIYNHRLKGDEAGIRTSGNSHDIRIYGNFIHDNNFGIHPNDSYNHPDGCGDGISQYNIFIYNNLIFKNEAYGIVLSYGGHCSPTQYSPDILKNIFIYNNVIAENGFQSRYGENRAGLTVRAVVDNLIVRNNIFYKNRFTETDVNKQYQISLVDAGNMTLENNQYCRPETSGKAIIDWGGRGMTLSEIQALKHEDDMPAGAEGDPGFVDAPNYDYALSENSVCKDTGYNLGSVFAEGLDPGTTKWSEAPPVIKAKERSIQGLWERGAFVYNPLRTSHSVLSAPRNLKVVIR